MNKKKLFIMIQKQNESVKNEILLRITSYFNDY